MTWPKYTPVATETQRLRARMLELRVRGWSFPRCADELGITQGYAFKLYKQAMTQIIEPGVHAVRDLELVRLDGLVEECYTILGQEHYAVSGGKVVRDFMTDADGKIELDNEEQAKLVRIRDYSIRLATMDRLLKIGERRARLLGLDAPTKTALTDPTGEKPMEAVQVYLPSNGRDATDTDGDGSGN